ncbi:MAG TPA: hypothetical protein VFB62_20585 [Polyangiaceae bacterium]|jgi:hypothetical protein|nr:hypothetical protein [Polyangiaceae bacterium]
MGQKKKRPSLDRGHLQRRCLRDRALVELLIEALDEGWTGTLQLLDPSGAEHIVRFVHGRPAGIETRAQVAPIGEILRGLGLPDDQTLEARLASGSRYEMLTLRAMEHRGVVDSAVAREALRRQLLERLRALFGLLPDTRYLFHAGRNLLSSYHLREPIECDEGDVLRLIGHGVRLLYVEGSLTPPKRLPLRIRGNAPLAHLDLDDAELAVVAALLRDTMSVEELDACSIAPRESIEIIGCLLTALRFVEQPGDKRPPVGGSRRPRSGIVSRDPD